jgi:uncharacterized membrane protein (DUF373 family)
MNKTKINTPFKKVTHGVEVVIIVLLIVMMSGVLILATFELGYYLFHAVANSTNFFIPLDNLMDLFGVFLLVLIGIELLDTIKVYLRENVVHVEVVVLVAIIALARKVVILKIEELSGEIIIGIGVLITTLAVTYYILKKTEAMTIKPKNHSDDENENNLDEKINK